MTALLVAARLLDYDEVSKLLDNGADVNEEMEGHWVTVLDQAAAWGDHRMVKLLIDRGATFDTPTRSYTGMTVFQNAVDDEYEKIVRLMITAGVDINASAAKNGGRTALQAAAGKGNKTLVQLLLDAGADINAPPAESSGRTALQAAARKGSEMVMRLLIENGADVNAPACEIGGYTALQAAARRGNERLLKLLIEHGADLNAPPADGFGRTALQAAAECGYEKSVRLLIDNGAEINAPAGESAGRTALHAAVRYGFGLIVELLIEKGADVNAPAAKDGGRTALQAAAEHGHETIVQFLIEKGADVNAPGAERFGKTALRAAIEMEDGGDTGNVAVGEGTDDENETIADKKQKKILRMATLFLDAKANVDETLDEKGRNALHIVCQGGKGRDPKHDLRLLDVLLRNSTPRACNAQDASGSTPLHFAVRQQNLAAVELLLLKDVDVETKDNSGRTVLQIAFRDETDDICKLLLAEGARTDRLPLVDLPTLRSICGKGEEDVVILQDDMIHGIIVANAIEYVPELKDTVFHSPSICFPR